MCIRSDDWRIITPVSDHLCMTRLNVQTVLHCNALLQSVSILAPPPASQREKGQIVGGDDIIKGHISWLPLLPNWITTLNTYLIACPLHQELIFTSCFQ